MVVDSVVDDLRPGEEVIVTGYDLGMNTSGVVGSIAVSIPAQSGYRVMAASGKEEKRQYLLDLWAQEVIGREQAQDTSGRPGSAY